MGFSLQGVALDLHWGCTAPLVFSATPVYKAVQDLFLLQRGSAAV